MGPLKTNRYALSWLCLYPSPEATSTATLLAERIFAVQSLINSVVALGASIVFVYQHISDDLQRSLEGIGQMPASMYFVYTQIFAHILRSKIVSVIDHIREFHKSHENDAPMYAFLQEANKQSEGFTKLYFKIIISAKTVAITILLLKLIYIFFFVGMDEYKSSTYQLITPWNDETPQSNLGIDIYSTLVSIIFLFINATFLTFFVGISKNCQALQHQFEYLVGNLNPSEANESLRRLIQFHQSAKEIYFQTSELFSVFIWLVIASSTVHVSVLVFQLDLTIGTNSNESPADYVTAMIASSLNILMYCYFGKKATDSFASMADALYDSKWLEFPPELRKYFVIVIENTQRPLYFHGFNIMVLDLRTFTTVIRTVFSYYMMFKTLNE